jgi:hypothetical protein
LTDALVGLVGRCWRVEPVGRHRAFVPLLILREDPRLEMEPADPFRQFFLTSIQSIVRQDPNASSLLQLLQTVAPSLTVDQISDSVDRNKAFKLLKLRIHPDKHLSDLNQATKLFQDVQEFFHRCCQQLEYGGAIAETSSSVHDKNRKRKSKTGDDTDDNAGVFPQEKKSSTGLIQYSVNFTVFDKWKYMTTDTPSKPLNEDLTKQREEDTRTIPSEYLSSMIAFRCLNARGAIAHGKKITHGFAWDDVKLHPSDKCVDKATGTTTNESTVPRIFQTYGGGCKVLSTVSQIKDELLHRGPVVSLSFSLSSEYLQCLASSNKSYSHQFVKDKVGGYHEMLIVGWALTLYGEVWLCQPLFPDQTDTSTCNSDGIDLFIPISMGHFGIDRTCIAPKLVSLDHLCWQKGPYFDVDFNDTPDWREWGELELPLVDMELKRMFNVFLPQGFSKACSDRTPIVLRDKNKFAHSDTFVATDLKWAEKTNEWFMMLSKKS